MRNLEPASVRQPRLSQAQEEEMDRMVRQDLPCLDLRVGPALVRRGWATEHKPISKDLRPSYRITLAGIQAYLRAVRPSISDRAYGVLIGYAKRSTLRALEREGKSRA